MIPVIHRMRDTAKSRVRKLIDYVSSDKGNPERIGDVFISNCGGVTPQFIALEMDATQRLNTKSQDDKTFHLTVSFPGGEKPTTEQMKEIEEQIAKALGFEEHQRFAVVHNDTDNTHIHMVINKIHPSKNTIHTPYGDQATVAKVCAKLERELGLGLDNHEKKKTQDEAKIDDIERKSGIETFASYAREHVPAALETAKTWDEFHNTLANNGITVALRGNGLIFADSSGEYAAKGSTIGRAFSKTSIEKMLGVFEAAAAAEILPKENLLASKKSTEYAERPKHGEKELFTEYREAQKTATEARKRLLDTTAKEQGEAIAAAKKEAARIVGSQTLANVFRTERVKQALIRTEEAKLIREVQAQFEAKKDTIKQTARKEYAEWLTEKAAAGDQRAAQTLEKQTQKAGVTAGAEAEKPNLYGEYAKIRDAAAAARKTALAALREEQGKAVQAAKAKARITVNAHPMEFLRTDRLSNYLRRQEERKASDKVFAEFCEKRDRVYAATKTIGYVDWLKIKAEQGDTRAITTLRARGETAPALISITAKQMKYAKIVAQKIAAVTSKGTLFYKVGEDVYRDNGKHLSLKTGVTDEGIKNALLLAASKFAAPLTLNGADDFKARCVEVAVRERLPVTFDDKALEAKRKGAIGREQPPQKKKQLAQPPKLKEEQEKDRAQATPPPAKKRGGYTR